MQTRDQRLSNKTMSAQQATAVPLPSHLVIELKNINFGERIAMGSCGPVFAGTLVTGEKVAIKELTGPEAMDACVRECGKHMVLHHRNIVRVFGVSEDGGKVHAYIITELAPGGSLADALKSHPQRNDWSTLVRWALDIAYGVQYLHTCSSPVLHLDLKPQNVLLFEDNTAKLCDFGIAHIMKHTATRQTAMQYSPQYAAPEQFDEAPVCEAADVYGLGGVLFTMITKSEPWNGLSMLQISKKLGKDITPSLPSSLPDQCPPEFAAIVQRCLQIDLLQRCSLSQIIDDLVVLHDKLASQPPSRIVTQHFARGPLPSAGWLSDVAAASSLLEILNFFESCPAPPERSDIRFPVPALVSIREEYDRVASYIPRSKFNSDQDHEDAMTVGLYTDESFVYWLVNGWANDTSVDQARGLRHVGPFIRRLIEALPRCCARYCGPAVRVLRAGQSSPQVMRDAFDDYEHQFAEGTVLHFCGFASFARGSKADDSFTRDFSIVLYCRTVEAYDVDRYSMMRLARGHSEKEVLCLAPSAFRVSHPPTKTQRAVTVYTDMQANPGGPFSRSLNKSLNEVDRSESIRPNVGSIVVKRIPTTHFGVPRLPSHLITEIPTPPVFSLRLSTLCKSAKRFISYLTPCPQSHAECWAGYVPTTLDEKATVRMLSRFQPKHEGFRTSHVALMCGSSTAAKLVLDTVYAADSIETSKGLTLLQAAALGGQPPEVLQALIQRGCNPTAKDANGCSVMHYAAVGGCVEAMKLVMANGGSMGDKDNDGWTVMMAAAQGGSVEAMKFVLVNGGDMLEKTSDGLTVMMYAAQGGSVEAMKFVFDKGFSMSEKSNSDGLTVMMYAAQGGSVEAMKFVLANGGDMTEKTSDGLTVMMYAAQGGSVEAMKFVLANGGNMTEKATDRSTVMMYAAQGGSVEAMKFVLANGGDMTEKTSDGLTVMMYAAQGGSVEAMKYVLANGGDMTEKATDRSTVMMYAAQGGSAEAIMFVLANGGSIMEKNLDGTTVCSRRLR